MVIKKGSRWAALFVVINNDSLGLFFNLERAVSTELLEVEEEKEVDNRHAEWDVGIRLEGGAIAVLIRFHDSFLIWCAFFAGLFCGF